eukprot:1545866-Pleurochrysis_carterae.AAC.1
MDTTLPRLASHHPSFRRLSPALPTVSMVSTSWAFRDVSDTHGTQQKDDEQVGGTVTLLQLCRRAGTAARGAVPAACWALV